MVQVYIPKVDEYVIGVVIDRRFEAYTVDIGAPTVASLPVLAFERATRRNAPNLQVGAAFYARVVKAHRDIHPELSCMDELSCVASNKAAGCGPLKGGYIFDCSKGLIQMLSNKPTCPLLEALGKSLTFDLTVGKNGRVWVNSEAPATVVIVTNAILNSESLTSTQQQVMVRRLLEHMSK